MKLRELSLHNIGPFHDESIVFHDDEDSSNQNVTIITGENGSGKTIIIDAIRYIFYGPYKPDEDRNIVKDENNFSAKLTYKRQGDSIQVVEVNSSDQRNGAFNNKTGTILYSELWNPAKNDWFLFDYWTSKLSTDSFQVHNVSAPQHEDTLKRSLSGIHRNAEISQLIVYFDYLRSSDDEDEKALGDSLYTLTKKVFDISITHGKFLKVERRTLKPIVTSNGVQLTMEKLSSGNLYLLQRLISLIGKAYAIFSLNKEKTHLDKITDIPGILIIDEAENHLHPKWQKTFLKDIISIFPNLQIIVTTHSPFIVSSIENAKVYVCENSENGSKIYNATETYSNKPIDEILTTPLFNTSPFGEEISNLLAKRKQAIESSNKEEETRLENELMILNPQYFSYFDLQKIIKKAKI